MSNPDGFMIKGVAYPAQSIRLEMAMSDYINELEAELAELREASAAVVMEKERLSTYIGGPVSIDGLNRLIKKLAALLLESSDE